MPTIKKTVENTKRLRNLNRVVDDCSIRRSIFSRNVSIDPPCGFKECARSFHFADVMAKFSALHFLTQCYAHISCTTFLVPRSFVFHRNWLLVKSLTVRV